MIYLLERLGYLKSSQVEKKLKEGFVIIQTCDEVERGNGRLLVNNLFEGGGENGVSV